ncbi:hypothetical protein [Bacillus alveayuensis]|jgi:hypothetical protein|uniref:hypothetical protein n=1 Tax=Aeribacillus alveayuensis TaxID=279215 RepID=UPI0005CD74C6|nr:hypothetical protein [Bacillus alveayuensis]
MNKIVFSRNFLKKHQQQHNSVHEILRNLEPETEVNVHVGEQTYYNAVFLAFDMNNNQASFLTDRFYKNGNRLTVLNSNDITSIDLPVSANKGDSVDNEDE